VGERRLLLHTLRWRLLVIGVVSGLMGSLPSTLVWALGR
jgi:hypothetical protein